MNTSLWYVLIALFIVLVAVFVTIVVTLISDLMKQRAARAFADEEKRRAELERVFPRR